MLHCSPTINFESVIFQVISPTTVLHNPSSIVPSSRFVSVKCLLSKFLICFLLTASYLSSHHHQASVDNTLNSHCYFTTQPPSVTLFLLLNFQFQLPSLTFLTPGLILFSLSLVFPLRGCAPPLSESERVPLLPVLCGDLGDRP